VWGTLWASASYSRHGSVTWRTLAPALVAALVGAAAGAWLVTQVPADWLRRLLPWMLTAVLVSTLARRDLGQTHAPRFTAAREAAVAALISLLLGLYDGFFGPGTGSFLIFLFVRVLGFDFLHAVGSAKVINSATNLASLAVFAGTGHVWWHFMLPMAVANVLGSMLGTTLALKHGSGFVRRVFLAVVTALVLKTAFDAVVR
ncbi:MAG: sulfite exporter TauE/SafE family protein, partial [Planctomycetia bacterium]